MDINKILIWIWILLSSILLIENMVQPLPHVFIWKSNTFTLSFISVIIWIWIWVWIRWFLSRNNDLDDENDF